MSLSKTTIMARLLVVVIAFACAITSPSASAATDSGSISFNGSQFLSSTNMSAPNTGTFTYEFWFYNTAEAGTNQTLMNSRGSVSTFQQRDGFDVAITSTRGLFASYRSLAFFNLPDGSISTNRWYHFAIVRQANTVYSYLDGSLIASQALAGDGLNLYSQNLQIGSTVNGANKFNGFISNFRYTKNSLYSANFLKPTDDYQAVSDTSILLQTKSGATFATNSIAGTTFANNGGAVSSSRNPFERSQSDVDAEAAEADRKKREEERIAAIKAAREKIYISLENRIEVTTSQLIEADLPIRSVASLNLAYQELISIRSSLKAPLTSAAVENLKYKKFMKYVMIERMAGVSSGKVYARDLVNFDIINDDFLMKSLALSKLMNLPINERDSVEKIDKFLSSETARNAALKSRVQARKR